MPSYHQLSIYTDGSRHFKAYHPHIRKLSRPLKELDEVIEYAALGYEDCPVKYKIKQGTQWVEATRVQFLAEYDIVEDETYGRNNGMNYSTAVILMSDQVNAVGVKFGTADGGLSQKECTYKTTEKLELGDLVLVNSGDHINHYKVAEVTNTNPEVPFEGDRKIKWIIQKVDLTSLEENVEREQAVLDVVMKADEKSKQQQLRAMLLPMFDEEDMKLLSFE